MSDERLIESLAELAREENAPMDPRLERLVEGTLTDEELRELEADAARDPALSEALALFSPLSAEARARIADRVIEARAPAPERSNVVPMRRKTPVMIAAVMALAAALLLAIFLPRQSENFPTYALELTGGERVLRSGQEAEQLVIGPGTKLEAVLRPEHSVTGGVDTRLVIELGGRIRTVDVKPEVSGDGAVRWVVRGAELAHEAGEGWLVFAVSAPGRMPPEEVLAGQAREGSKPEGEVRVLSRRATFRTTAE